MSDYSRQLIVAAGRACERLLFCADAADNLGDLESAAYFFDAAEHESFFAFDVAKRGR